MPDQFADALERLDITFEDFESMDGLIGRLDAVLSGNQARASALQIDIAAAKFRGEQERLRDFGFNVDFFQRGGRRFLQVRDAAGRFAGTGRAAVARILRFGF